MHLRLLPEKGKYKIHGGVKMKGTVKRDFKVLTEKISPENIVVMAELIAMRETKALIGFMGYHAEKAHKKLCKESLINFSIFFCVIKSPLKSIRLNP